LYRVSEMREKAQEQRLVLGRVVVHEAMADAWVDLHVMWHVELGKQLTQPAHGPRAQRRAVPAAEVKHDGAGAR